MTKEICVAYGDGIGPEIMTSVLKILSAANVGLKYDVIKAGEKVYQSGSITGIADTAWEKIKRNKVLLKSPMTTPLGGGYKSINVTLRKTLGLFANVRPVRSYAPFISCNAKSMDVVIVRENEEDLYSGIEYQATQNSYVAMKIVSESGSKKIIRHAFDYARSNGRKKVTCFTKNNIMKLSDGMFARIFDEVAAEYPEIEKHHMLIDIGSARIASKPEDFDVVVTLNLYGDIISDIAAEAAGAVGIAGSANIGNDGYAMFEAVHGSAPDIAGQNKANPSGLLSAAIMMLRHLDLHDDANVIENAWLTTIEQGIHTGDLFNQGISRKLVSTSEFTDVIIQNLGQKPTALQPVHVKSFSSSVGQYSAMNVTNKDVLIIGYDVYIRDIKRFSSLVDVANAINRKLSNMDLHFIAHKGLVIWSDSNSDWCGISQDIDMLQLRFIGKNALAQLAVIDLLKILTDLQFEIVMVNTLSSYDTKNGFSKAQGE